MGMGKAGGQRAWDGHFRVWQVSPQQSTSGPTF